MARQYTRVLTQAKELYRRKNKILGIFYGYIRMFSRKCQVVWRQIVYPPKMCQPRKEVQADSANAHKSISAGFVWLCGAPAWPYAALMHDMDM
jgi:hypothetical protein